MEAPRGWLLRESVLREMCHFWSPLEELPANPLLRQALAGGKKLTRRLNADFQPVAEWRMAALLTGATPYSAPG
jgi:hypothetical protein